MALRIEIDESPDGVRRAIEAGEAVEIVRDGCTVARLPGNGGTWGEYLEWRRSATPLDVDYERDIADGLSTTTQKPLIRFFRDDDGGRRVPAC